ncbi:MAG: transposase [Bacteroidales bacterium]|jgi:REP element-mobilizing transposase RayT|nr:transposase [Bacteroidales bacterium]MDD4215217.1 transposase [Bacteroidales bacterium]
MGFKYKIYDQCQAYYLTFTVVKWIDIFSRKIYKDIIIESLKHCQKNKGLNIFAYVIMTNHMHLLVNSEMNDLSQTVCDFKKFSSKKIIKTIQTTTESRKDWMLNLFSYEGTRNSRNKNYQFWIQDNHPIEIFSNKFIKQKVEYIHNNPVRAGIVVNPWDYLYSSARNYADMESFLDVIKVDLNVL